ncbi:MAG: hypothetical protein S4CHLAM7_08810 [Chlamydiae bacterium]|nr:hypothetical protein [Chlamydiota bacterium]
MFILKNFFFSRGKMRVLSISVLSMLVSASLISVPIQQNEETLHKTNVIVEPTSDHSGEVSLEKSATNISEPAYTLEPVSEKPAKVSFEKETPVESLKSPKIQSSKTAKIEKSTKAIPQKVDEDQKIVIQKTEDEQKQDPNPQSSKTAKIEKSTNAIPHEVDEDQKVVTQKTEDELKQDPNPQAEQATLAKNEDKKASKSWLNKMESWYAKSFTPYVGKSPVTAARKNIFFQTNVGIGFLYFAGVQGNLMGKPSVNWNTSFNFRDVPYKGRLGYNRTAIYEYLLGYQLNNCFKVALSYQYQGGVNVFTPTLSAYQRAAVSQTNVAQLQATLALNGLMAKIYCELPFGMSIGSLTFSPYMGAGVGPGWQSWTDIEVNYMFRNNRYLSDVLYLRQKYQANLVWMIDMGFRAQNTSPNTPISMFMGCKYNQWGQVQGIGKITQQDGFKLGLFQPFSVNMIYQFAPYLGVQWNFPNGSVASSSKVLKAELSSNTSNTRSYYWLPSWKKTKDFAASRAIWTQFNAGLGLLYFNKVRGNFAGQPSATFSIWRDVPYKRGLSYNRTPLMEYLIGYRFNHWIKAALSYQYQAGVSIQSESLPTYSSLASAEFRFNSQLKLDALLAKVYLELPFGHTIKGIAATPYLAVGVGPGWQTWTRTMGTYMFGNTGFAAESIPFRTKISANAVWMLDTGFRVQSTSPNSPFNLLVGCKYNQWGQARNIGQQDQQGSLKVGFTQPFRIKTVYQFAPYLGVQWNFFNGCAYLSSYQLRGKSPNVWRPYWVASKQFQCPTGFWTQFNTGVGFLYFSGVNGNFMGRPQPNFDLNNFENARDVPYKGTLSYNRTPLFEYLIGYRYNIWLKFALSYQYQGNIYIQTKVLPGFVGGAGYRQVSFSSQLSLNALMLKVYFELPFSMIFKNLSASPYLAVGVGPGWQTWNKTRTEMLVLSSSFDNNQLPLRQKIVANAAWMLDTGFRFQSAYPRSLFSVLVGCKYNQWGQTRSIGKMSQQGSHKLSLVKPFRIKTVYQFAPYIGVQWNY